MSWPPFRPAARKEFDSTVDEFGEIGKALARRFVRRTTEVIAILRMFPGSGSPGRWASEDHRA